MLLLASALLLGCGARSALDVAGVRDEGDGGAIPGVDAGTHACRLAASDPVVVHEDALGPFDQPQVVARSDGTLDLVARRVGDRRETSEVRARRARVLADGTVGFLDAPTRLFGPSIWNRAGALGTVLGTCSTLGGPTDRTELRTFDTDYREAERAMPLAALACHDLVGRADRWLLVTRGIAEGTVVLERQRDGRMVRGPAAAFDPAVGANASAASIDDGFAWVGVLDVDGRVQVVFRDDAGSEAREEFRLERRSGAAKPIIGLGFGPGSAAIAYYDRESLYVTILTRGRGRTLTSPALTLTTGADVDPALARIDGHLLAISLNYGDRDSAGGALDIQALGSGLTVTDELSVETHRDPRYGGVSAAVVDRTAVVHWAERDADGAARTLVMTLACR